jgi:hypothetical protein
MIESNWKGMDRPLGKGIITLDMRSTYERQINPFMWRKLMDGFAINVCRDHRQKAGGL